MLSSHFNNQVVAPRPIVFKSGKPISVICPAATFTGLTYSNNGEKVRLSSSGVHGLTTSPAVGAKIWVDWSGGTGVSGLYTVLAVGSTTTITIDLAYAAGLGTATVAAAGTEINIDTFNLPIMPIGSKIRFTALMTMTNSSNSKNFKAKINGTYVGGTTPTTVKDYSWVLEGGYTGNNVKIFNNYLAYGSTSSAGAFIFPEIDTSLSNIMTLHATPYAANETITYQIYKAEVFI